MSTRLPYLKHATDSHRDPWLRSMIREHGDAFHRMYWDLLEMLQADGSGEEVTLLSVNLYDLSAAMMRKPTLVLKFLDVLSSKRNGFVKYKYERTGDELEISAFKFRDYQHNLGSRAGADGNHNGGGSGVDKTRYRQEERVPSIGIESKTETKTPPTQSNNKGAGKLIRSMDGSDVCCTRFDLWPEDGQRSSNRAPEPQPVATHGQRWVWDSSSLCWYAETLNDSRAWFCGFTSVEWARISFDRQKQIESEFGDDGEANRAHAMQLYYAEARRRDKIREDANGNTHGKTKPDSHRKFFK